MTCAPQLFDAFEDFEEPTDIRTRTQLFAGLRYGALSADEWEAEARHILGRADLAAGRALRRACAAESSGWPREAAWLRAAARRTYLVAARYLALRRGEVGDE